MQRKTNTTCNAKQIQHAMQNKYNMQRKTNTTCNAKQIQRIPNTMQNKYNAKQDEKKETTTFDSLRGS
jgi:hypothetical protein